MPSLCLLYAVLTTSFPTITYHVHSQHLPFTPLPQPFLHLRELSKPISRQKSFSSMSRRAHNASKTYPSRQSQYLSTQSIFPSLSQTLSSSTRNMINCFKLVCYHTNMDILLFLYLSKDTTCNLSQLTCLLPLAFALLSYSHSCHPQKDSVRLSY